VTPDPKPPKPVLLTGKAYTAFRQEVFEHYQGICQKCKEYAPLRDPEGQFNVFTCGHVAHIAPRRKGGDVLSNAKWKCYHCHIIREHCKGEK
jgi:hypothetical protein